MFALKKKITPDTMSGVINAKEKP